LSEPVIVPLTVKLFCIYVEPKILNKFPFVVEVFVVSIIREFILVSFLIDTYEALLLIIVIVLFIVDYPDTVNVLFNVV